MKSKDFFSRNTCNGIFSVFYFSEVWDMGKKKFLMFWSLTALYFLRGIKDILKSLDFKNVKTPKYLSPKQHLKYHILEYNIALLGWTVW